MTRGGGAEGASLGPADKHPRHIPVLILNIAVPYRFLSFSIVLWDRGKKDLRRCAAIRATDGGSKIYKSFAPPWELN